MVASITIWALACANGDQVNAKCPYGKFDNGYISKWNIYTMLKYNRLLTAC